MVDSIEEFFEVEINNDMVALGNVTLRLGDRLMGRASRTESVAMLRKRRVPSLLQYLQHGLLDQSVDDARHVSIELHSVATDLWDRLKSPTRFIHYEDSGL